jgi:hypothetical protein
MTDATQIANPYVGPKAFEKEDAHLFFGRDREVQELSSLLIAHPAVLLYAQSGAGKTSLINAGLIPELERDRFEVFPPARVRATEQEGSDLADVGNIFRFHSLMSWSGLPDLPQGFARMSLAAFLKERAHSLDHRGRPKARLLIFDQFEELFTFYPARWAEREGFFQDLAQCLAEDPLLRVLLVMREDYLANLDAYNAILPEGLHTRYRLECLGRYAAGLAVQKPVEKTGREFAEGVAAELVEKLASIRAQGVGGRMVDAPGEYVEPVQLQVVCQDLWNKVPPDARQITFDHLKKYGDVSLALQNFYESALKTARQKTGIKEDVLRGLFEYKLITAFGTRGTVLRGTDSSEGVPNAAIDELENQHIIRSETRAGAHWYELTHDRLIEPVRKSNESWKRRFEQRRKWKRIARVAVPTLVVAAFLVLLRLQSYETKQAELQRQLQERQAEVERLRTAAQMESLKDSLLRVQEKKNASERERAAEEQWIKYGQLEEAMKRGDQLDRDLALGSVTSYLWSRNQTRNLDTLEKILKKNTSPSGRNYLVDPYTREMLPAVKQKEDWPITLVYNEESGLEEGELRYQWHLFTRTIASNWGIPFPVRVKLRTSSVLPPDTVEVDVYSETGKPESTRIGISNTEETVVVRLDTIPPNLQPFVDAHEREWQFRHKVPSGAEFWFVPKWTAPIWRAGHWNSDPREAGVALLIFERLLEKPEFMLTPESVAFLLERFERSYPQTVSEALRRCRSKEDIRKGFVEIVKSRYALSRMETILNAFANFGADSLDRAVDAAVSNKGFSILPTRLEGVQNTAAPAEQRLANDAQGSRRAITSQPARYRKAYEEVLPWLPDPAARNAGNDGGWVTPEYARLALDSVQSGIRKWIESHYTLTDFKLILQSLQQRGSNQTGQKEMPWLMSSLVFWYEATDDPLLLADLTGRLQETENVRVNRLGPGSTSPAIDGLVKGGISLLSAGRVQQAQDAFAKALKADRHEAIRTFLSIYSDEATAFRLAAIVERECILPDPGTMSWASPSPDVKPADVKGYMRVSGSALGEDMRWKLNLWLLWVYTRAGNTSEAREQLRLLKNLSSTRQLSLNDGYLLGYFTFAVNRRTFTPPEDLNSAVKLLHTAFSQWDEQEAQAKFEELVDRYSQTGHIPQWYALALDSLTRMYPRSFWMPLVLGEYLMRNPGREADADKALDQFKRAQDNIYAVNSPDRRRLGEWVTFYRGEALLARAEYGEEPGRTRDIEAAVEVLRELTKSARRDSTGWVSFAEVYNRLADGLIQLNRLEEAATALDEALRRFPNNATLLGSSYFLHLAELKPDLMAEDIQRYAAANQGSRDQLLFLRALQQFVSSGDRFESTAREFLKTTHVYVDYVRMMLFDVLSKKGREREAEALLDSVKALSDSSWTARLDHGEPGAWRETLLRHYSGLVSRDQIFDWLEDYKTFDRSVLRHVGLPLTGLQCEASFYDAILQEGTGDPSTRAERYRESLERALSSKHSSYYEYHMARYLLSKMTSAR